ncbi:TPA: hypothetical protein ACNV18_000842 [Pseudomonas putida]|uniref:hypothetical protein n=1 Tax=Pseudomonas TaxID=286 RepID=UPI0012DF0E49|nr:MULTISPECIES: hypothetical protein [Pseudomonas]EKV3204544.1 hypothetical protein [Pseudomonas aeruginosa]MBH4412250.1 hypothetical protein [Pseudomonas aeruginosa]UZM92188.1 hypothetical protein OPZ46_20280 [Pseudomonas putida DOT-T1E]
MSKYVDLTVKKSKASVIIDKTVMGLFIIGVIALCFGAVSMMNDGKGEIDLRIEQKQ